MAAQLWGWLGQHDDPLEGKALAEKMLREMLGLDALRSALPAELNGTALRPSRLSAAAQSALLSRFGFDGFSVDPDSRAAFSLGQSYPDQLARRAGIVADPVDAVVSPANSAQANDLLQRASKLGFCVMASGGATNVTGGFAVHDQRPRVAASMLRMNRLIAVNEPDLTAEAEAGIRLPELEEQLNARGFTLGHFPQSFHGATLGGSIAAHGSGQRSAGYGRMSDMLISATLATPRGLWTSEAQRHTADGPWLGGLVTGSEGLFGLIVSVTVRIKRKPETVEDCAWYLPSFDAALGAASQLAQSDASLSMLRVSDAAETRFLGQFRLAMKGMERATALERVALAVKRAPSNPVLLLAGFEGGRGRFADVISEVGRIIGKAGGVSLGRGPGVSWRKSRYDLPYLRESLLRRGIGVDTFETVAPWSRLAELKSEVGAAFDHAMAATLGERLRGVLMCHLSHSYPEAGCLYFTAIFPQAEDRLGQWRLIKTGISTAIGTSGGAASHHHGVGVDHAEMARAGKGEIGVELLRALKATLDPENLLVSGMGRLLA